MTRLPTETQVEEVSALIMRNGFTWEQRVDAGAFAMHTGRSGDWMAIVSVNEVTNVLDGIVVNGPVFCNLTQDQLTQLAQHAKTVETMWDTTVKTS